MSEGGIIEQGALPNSGTSVSAESTGSPYSAEMAGDNATLTSSLNMLAELIDGNTPSLYNMSAAQITSIVAAPDERGKGIGHLIDFTGKYDPDTALGKTGMGKAIYEQAAKAVFAITESLRFVRNQEKQDARIAEIREKSTRVHDGEIREAATLLSDFIQSPWGFFIA